MIKSQSKQYLVHSAIPNIPMLSRSIDPIYLAAFLLLSHHIGIGSINQIFTTPAMKIST